MNLISVDSQKIEDACLMINLMWSCPLQVGLAIYFLYQTIGVSVFVGKSDNFSFLTLIPFSWLRLEADANNRNYKLYLKKLVLTYILNTYVSHRCGLRRKDLVLAPCSKVRCQRTLPWSILLHTYLTGATQGSKSDGYIKLLNDKGMTHTPTKSNVPHFLQKKPPILTCSKVPISQQFFIMIGEMHPLQDGVT